MYLRTIFPRILNYYRKLNNNKGLGSILLLLLVAHHGSHLVLYGLDVYVSGNQ
jgi:hypothetical protein